MDTRKVSTVAGFVFLVGCIVTVIVVIYNGASSRSSYKTSMEESWRKREMRMKERQEVLGSVSLSTSATIPTGSPVQEAKDLAEELQKLFMNKETKGRKGVVENGRHKTGEVLNGKVSITTATTEQSTTTILPTTSKTPSLYLSPEMKNRAVNSHYYVDEKKTVDRGVEKTESTKLVKGLTTANDSYQMSRLPSINSRLEKIAEDQASGTSKRKSNILLVQSLPSAPQGSSSPPISRHSSTSMSSAISSNPPSNLSHINPKNEFSSSFSPSQSSSSLMHNPIWDTQDLPSLDYGEHQYEIEEDEDENELSYKRDPLQAMGNLIQLFTDVYKRGAKGLDLNGFLRVINETVQLGGNNNNILNHLNQFYSTRAGGVVAPKSEPVGHNVLGNSLSAFVFMTFGIFLLNQIHNFMETEKSDENARRGRKLDLDLNWMDDDSELNFLFEAPVPSSTQLQKNASGSEPLFPNVTSTPNTNLPQKLNFISKDAEGRENNHQATSSSKTSLNNVFRAALNLVNAYTKKDSQVLECIWSKYCENLDKTAAKQESFYSLAARINSVGLRLIMGQIPTELTVDVVLRSLLGWDGLPCQQMFSKCHVANGIVEIENERFPSHNNESLLV